VLIVVVLALLALLPFLFGATAFNGGAITEEAVVAPQSTGNSSTTLAKLVRNGGEVWAGAQIDLTSKLDFSVEQYVKFQIWTAAPIGTRIVLKLEDKTNGTINSGDREQFTTVTSAWETLDNKWDRVALLPNLNTLGNGSSASTFYYDNIQQSANLNPLSNKDFEIAGLNVYPNPARDSWTVKTQNINMSSIQVFDVLGKNVLSFKPNASEATINGSSLKAGLYFARINTLNGSSSLKLIKN
jgi:endo-1,3(4)-beta-glucanase